MLLDAGLDLNTTDSLGTTVMFLLLRSNDRSSQPETRHGLDSTLSFSFKRGILATSLIHDGSNALHVASAVSTEIIDVLTANGIDINQVRKRDGRTPLLAALERQDVVSARNLLLRGAEANLA